VSRWILCRVAKKARSRSQVRRFARQGRRGKLVRLWEPQIGFLRRWYDIEPTPWSSLPYPLVLVS
jgi:hypothetical protein